MMKEKIQLIHPAGKKAIRMDRIKYDVLKYAFLEHLRTNGESAHTEIYKSIISKFALNNIKFEGSIEWHMEWVKLDLEARNEIKRKENKYTVLF